MHAGTKMNLLDTPGYADFAGEVRAGLRAADGALFVVAANEPVDGSTWQLWRECADVGMPRAVVVTKLDQPAPTTTASWRRRRPRSGSTVSRCWCPVTAGAGSMTGVWATCSTRARHRSRAATR